MSIDSGTLTVRELIALLGAVENQDAKVETEGCDCYGDAADVKVTTSGRVIIMRTPAADNVSEVDPPT